MAGDSEGIGPESATLFGELEHPVKIVKMEISNVPAIFMVKIVSDVDFSLCRSTQSSHAAGDFWQPETRSTNCQA